VIVVPWPNVAAFDPDAPWWMFMGYEVGSWDGVTTEGVGWVMW
jgi:hypothetical protein